MVGVIANLATSFAVHTLFARSRTVSGALLHLELPEPTRLQLPALALTAIACALILAVRWPVLRTLGVCAVLGIALQLLLLR